ncbi:hypothetical protein [Endozoicomonas numazuensis]|uniref:Uncharacterized protein n=1 Tax=Endozoicomonas numazuensis TaxID=1137799 RepID=A0A081NJ29_9GAMM|nr:hypothetical protein [Endozoicomonas numazuensis]KEQ18452.1 hypothetical protein GZ78_13260 [Endozoicomonas numazuensis]
MQNLDACSPSIQAPQTDSSTVIQEDAARFAHKKTSEVEVKNQLPEASRQKPVAPTSPVQMVEDHAIVDLRKIPLYQLLMPEFFFSESFCKHLEAFRHRSIEELEQRFDQTVKTMRLGSKHTALIQMTRNAMLSLSRMDKSIAPLNKLGAQFRVHLAKVGINTKEISDRAFHSTDFRLSTSMLKQLGLFEKHKTMKECFGYPMKPSLKLPCTLDPDPEFNPELYDIFCQFLSDQLRGTTHDFPVKLSGYVPSKFADPEASTRGYMDSFWSLNMSHGNLSHLLQLFIQKDTGHMNSDVLKWIIKNDLWTLIMEFNSFLSFDAFTVAAPQDDDLKILEKLGLESPVTTPARISLIGLRRALLGNSPDALHTRMFCSEFSLAIRQLNSQLSPADRALFIQKVLQQPPGHSDEDNIRILQQVESNLKLIEWIIQNNQLITLNEISKYLGQPPETVLTQDNALNGQFSTGTPQVEKCVREDARRDIANGKKVYGINDRGTIKVKLERHSKLEEYTSFMVYPG